MAVHPAPSSYKRRVIEDGLIANMANTAAYLQAFPFLSEARNAGRHKANGCGRCGGGGPQRNQIFNKIKEQIANLPDDKRKLLKKLLNAEEIQVSYRSGNYSLPPVVF